MPNLYIFIYKGINYRSINIQNYFKTINRITLAFIKYKLSDQCVSIIKITYIKLTLYNIWVIQDCIQIKQQWTGVNQQACCFTLKEDHALFTHLWTNTESKWFLYFRALIHSSWQKLSKHDYGYQWELFYVEKCRLLMRDGMTCSHVLGIIPMLLS